MKNLPEKLASKHDQDILNSIFNPLQPFGERFCDESIENDSEDEPETDEILDAKRFEVEGVKLAENGQVKDAINVFTKSIEAAPQRASGYNNRAQAYRLLGKDAEAMVDLNNAINLSQGKGRAARQAFCQRGMMRRREGNDSEAKNDFEAAAKLGSQFAKSQVVEMNPYAALCNKMLHDVFIKLQRGETD